MWYSIYRGEKVNLSVGDKVTIHCYKHDGSIHKSWKYAYVLDVKAEINNEDTEEIENTALVG